MKLRIFVLKDVNTKIFESLFILTIKPNSQSLPDMVPKRQLQKDDSQTSFDWIFSAPSSPTLPKGVVEEVPDEDDEGITFNIDQTASNNVNPKQDVVPLQRENKEEKVYDTEKQLNTKLNRTKKSLCSDGKTKRYDSYKY